MDTLSKIKLSYWAALFEVIRSDKRILNIPESMVMIKDLTADAMLISVLMWTSNTD